ncbi:MAG: AAA family ATPase [Chitinophagales bacterium]
MTRRNFYILTGGPGGGKTSLLNYLLTKGYPYIPETAREIIRHRLTNGLPPRPNPAEFARQMFSIDFDNYLSKAHLESLLFFDRSFLDSAYLLHDADLNAYKEIENTLVTNRYNQRVFVTPPWEEIYQTDSERDQTFAEAIEVYNKICSWYSKHNYEIIMIPNETIEIRSKFILEQVYH